MKKIIVDAMGSDNGPKAICEAILDFLKEHDDVEITVVGAKEEVSLLEGKCKIIESKSIVPMEAGPLEVMRLRDSSMYIAVNTMKLENYDAIISAGSTGGFLSAATLVLKNIPGVSRAALIAPFPTRIKNKKVVLLDIGASNENSPKELLQFGYMGALYSKAVYGVKEPATYLLSNGTEIGKGSPLSKEAYKLFIEDKFPNFKGNIEARNALYGDADVIVTDGFNGNVFLKGCEGIAKMMSVMIKSAFKRNIFSKIGYLLTRKGIKEMSETMDYKSTGGAMLLGINGVVVKAHGNSDKYSFKCALGVANSLVDANIVEQIRKGFNNGEN